MFRSDTSRFTTGTETNSPRELKERDRTRCAFTYVYLIWLNFASSSRESHLNHISQCKIRWWISMRYKQLKGDIMFSKKPLKKQHRCQQLQLPPGLQGCFDWVGFHLTVGNLQQMTCRLQVESMGESIHNCDTPANVLQHLSDRLPDSSFTAAAHLLTAALSACFQPTGRKPNVNLFFLI